MSDLNYLRIITDAARCSSMSRERYSYGKLFTARIIKTFLLFFGLNGSLAWKQSSTTNHCFICFTRKNETL